MVPVFLVLASAGVLFFRAYLHAARRERMATILREGESQAMPAGPQTLPLPSLTVAAMRGRTRLLVQAGLGILLALVTRNPLFFLLPFPALKAAERVVKRRKQRKAGERKEEQVLDFMDSVTQSLRSGLSLQQSLEASLDDIGEELRQEIAPVLRELRMGKGMEESLSSAAASSSSPSLRLILTVLGLLHAKGGDLPRILERMRRRVSEGLETRREIRVLTSQSRASGYLVSALPVIFVSLQAALNPSSLQPLLAAPLGNLILAVALGLNAVAFLIIRRMVNPGV